jgi:hypothetical protein
MPVVVIGKEGKIKSFRSSNYVRTWVPCPKNRGMKHLLPTVLRIRIGFSADPDTNPDPAFSSLRIRIWIQIQGFDDQKLEKICGRIFFLIKNCNYLSLALHKGLQSYRISLHLSKEKTCTSKLEFSSLLLFFGPPGCGSGSVFPVRIRIQPTKWLFISS